MTEKPLSYLSRKVLLKHLDFNIRFRLVQRVPSLQNMDKTIPRHIDYLCFDNMKMIINDTGYKLGTLRHYDTEVDNLRVVADNRIGGVPYDLTASGLEAEAFNDLTPGDIQIRAELDGGKRQQREYVLERKTVENIIELQEARLLQNNPSDDLDQMLYSVARYREFIDFMFNPHHIQPPQRTFIQLTVAFFGGPLIEKFSRANEKLHNAEKYLASRLFANTFENTVHVKRLVIYSDYLTIRLPENLKFKISELQTIGNFPRIFRRLNRVLKDPEPLKYLRLYGNIQTANNLNHSAIKSAKKLHLSCHIPYRLRFEILFNLRNKIVHFDNNCLQTNDWVRIVQLWIQENKEIGTCFTFSDSKYGVPVSAIMNKVIDRIGGKKVDQNCITVPMSITSELRLSYEPFLYNKWAFKMEVVRLEPTN